MQAACWPEARRRLRRPPRRQRGRQRISETDDRRCRVVLRDSRSLREVIEAAAHVAQEGVPGAQHAPPAQGLEAARRAEPPLEVLVIPLDALLDCLAGLVPRSREGTVR